MFDTTTQTFIIGSEVATGNYGGSGYSWVAHIRIDSTSPTQYFSMFNSHRSDSSYSPNGTHAAYSSGAVGYIEKGGTYSCDEGKEGHYSLAACDAGAADHSDASTGHWVSEFKGTDADELIYYNYRLSGGGNNYFNARWDITKYFQDGDYHTWILSQPTGHWIHRSRPTLNGITPGEEGTRTALDITSTFTDSTNEDGVGYIASKPSLFIDGEEITPTKVWLQCVKHPNITPTGYWSTEIGIFSTNFSFLGFGGYNPMPTGGVRNLEFHADLITASTAESMHKEFMEEDHTDIVAATGYRNTVKVIDLKPGKGRGAKKQFLTFCNYIKSGDTGHVNTSTLFISDTYSTLGANSSIEADDNTYITFDDGGVSPFQGYCSDPAETTPGTCAFAGGTWSVYSAKITNVSTTSGVTTLTLDKALIDGVNYNREFKIYNEEDYGNLDVVASHDDQSDIISPTVTNILHDHSGNGSHATFIDGGNLVSYIDNAIVTEKIYTKPYLNGTGLNGFDPWWDSDAGYKLTYADILRTNSNNNKSENLNMISLKNCVYIANSDSRGLLKYDGNSIYLAGLISSWDVPEISPDYLEPTHPKLGSQNTNPVAIEAGSKRFKSNVEKDILNGMTFTVLNPLSIGFLDENVVAAFAYTSVLNSMHELEGILDVTFDEDPFELDATHCANEGIFYLQGGLWNAQIKRELEDSSADVIQEYYEDRNFSSHDVYTHTGTKNQGDWRLIDHVTKVEIINKKEKIGRITFKYSRSVLQALYRAAKPKVSIREGDSITLMHHNGAYLDINATEATGAAPVLSARQSNKFPVNDVDKLVLAQQIEIRNAASGAMVTGYIQSIDKKASVITVYDPATSAALDFTVDGQLSFIKVRGPSSFRYLWQKAHKDAKGNIHYGTPSSQHLNDFDLGEYRLDLPYAYDGTTEVTNIEVNIPWAYEGDERGSLIIGGGTNYIYTYEDKYFLLNNNTHLVDDTKYNPSPGSSSCLISCQIQKGDNIFLYNHEGNGFCDEGITGHSTAALCDAGATDHTSGSTGHWVPGSQEFEVTDKEGPYTITTSGYPADSKYYKVTLKPKENEPNYEKIPSGGYYLYDGSSPYLRTFATLTGNNIQSNNCKDYKIWASASNHRLLLYRTKNIWYPDVNQYIADPTYYLVDEIALPANYFQTIHSPYIISTQVLSNAVYRDQFHDSALSVSEPFVVPDKIPGVPPKGKYLAVYNSQLIISGNSEAVDVVYYSDYTAPENFPQGTNSFTVDSEVTGLATLGRNLYIFQKDKIQVMNGDLILDSFGVSTLAEGMGIGTVCHNSIVEVNNTLFFLTENGIYSIQNSSPNIIEVSALIEPEFDKLEYDFEKATAFNWTAEDLYLMYLPKITKSTFQATTRISSKAAESTSGIILAYDYKRGTWTSWSGMLAGGGFANIDKEVYLASRRDVDDHFGVLSKIIPNKEYDKLYSYAGKTTPSHEYASGWEAIGDHTTPKKFLRLKTLADDSDYDVSAQTTTINIGKDFSASEVSISRYISGSHDILKLPTGKSRSIRVTYSGTGYFNIKGYELEVAQPIKAGEMKE